MKRKALYIGVLSMLLALITQAPFIYGTYYFLSKMPDTSFITAVMYLIVIVLSPSASCYNTDTLWNIL